MADGGTVALKFILPCDEQAVPHDMRFLLALCRLSHPNLMPVYWARRYWNYIVVATDVAQGSVLDLHRTYLSEFHQPIPAWRVRAFLAQAAEGLDFLNLRWHLFNGVWTTLRHGNIKPSNLLVVRGTVKLADLLLSSQSSFELPPHLQPESSSYSAPEVVREWENDDSDQYALAVTYCQLCGDRLPFSETPPLPDADLVRPQLDLTMLPEVERPIVARALAPAREDRWPSCGELMAQLSRVAA